MKRRTGLAALVMFLLAGCIRGPGQLAKTDIDRFADQHRKDMNLSLQRLAEKLYKRNPREWKKGGHASLENALASFLVPSRYGDFVDPEGKRGTAAILAGLHEDYPHDRVAAFAGGLAAMLHDAFEGKTEFFVLDDLYPQKLYNAARNVEIAAWKLANARRTRPEADLPAGTPLLFSNEMGPVQNLSFEREFGRLIGNLDTLSQVVSDRTNRTVVKMVQSIATAFFLPI